MPVNIIPRDQWGALPPRVMVNALLTPVQNVFCMNTHSKPCFDHLVCMGTLRLLQRSHMQRQNQRDIRYNFIVGSDGDVYEGRGWTSSPLLPREHSRLSNKSILIGYIGDFTAADLPANMSQAGYDLIEYGIQQGHIASDFLYYDILTKLHSHV
ncbi:peptidoglycan-recognition protein SB2-like [Macrosteles quadrilineatus]|uniref:peptidoglycan-recognition protein SB2-like n=1 Tax=Macrosteles quadrilineatus TaxID=74068 RepID=UPI0023E28381|nr:peptidoglycan-recognition protein SB2-like [Macrosteles quadrilineatus]XP_054264697.1 peptidoglycan-recognition protein SB2-like [Macrosteles quadrilineatus]